eukprot:6200997-Pleurochrysis_carterae.AAC.1
MNNVLHAKDGQEKQDSVAATAAFRWHIFRIGCTSIQNNVWPPERGRVKASMELFTNIFHKPIVLASKLQRVALPSND